MLFIRISSTIEQYRAAVTRSQHLIFNIVRSCIIHHLSISHI